VAVLKESTKGQTRAKVSKMWTKQYRGWWVYGYRDREECFVTAPDHSVFYKRVRSMHAAKCQITRAQRRAKMAE
jgi:hypothetical protein